MKKQYKIHIFWGAIPNRLPKLDTDTLYDTHAEANKVLAKWLNDNADFGYDLGAYHSIRVVSVGADLPAYAD